MILYLVRTDDRALKWTSVKTQAHKLVNNYNRSPKVKENPEECAYVEEHDVPVKKQELLTWLNSWCTFNLDHLDCPTVDKGE